MDARRLGRPAAVRGRARRGDRARLPRGRPGGRRPRHRRRRQPGGPERLRAHRGSWEAGAASAPRIEHAQCVDDADLPRFARAGRDRLDAAGDDRPPTATWPTADGASGPPGAYRAARPARLRRTRGVRRPTRRSSRSTRCRASRAAVHRTLDEREPWHRSSGSRWPTRCPCLTAAAAYALGEERAVAVCCRAYAADLVVLDTDIVVQSRSGSDRPVWCHDARRTLGARRRHPGSVWNRMTPSTTLPSAAPAVVIGGGVMGTSILFHLAEAGAQSCCSSATQLAAGSTSKAAGGVRPNSRTPEHRASPSAASQAFADFGRRPGWEIDLHGVGYLFLLTTRPSVEAFSASVALQNELGVPSRMISAEEARGSARCSGRATCWPPATARGRPRDAGGGRAGLRVRRAGARRAPRRSAARSSGIDARRRPDQRPCTPRRRSRPAPSSAPPARGRDVRRDGRRRAAGHAAAPPGAVHRADDRPAGARSR